jgi:hypothetical protein
MRKLVLHAAALLFLTAPASAWAGPYTDALSQCVVSSTSEADRQGFMRWMFAALSTNPALKDMANVKPEKVKELTKSAAELMERLIFTSCRPQVVAALKNEGGGALDAAFQALGNVAASDLLTNSETVKTLGEMQQFTDPAKFDQLAKEAGLPVNPPDPPK